MGIRVCVCVCVCVCVMVRITLEWVAISYTRGSAQSSDQTHISCIYWTGRWKSTTLQ